MFTFSKTISCDRTSFETSKLGDILTVLIDILESLSCLQVFYKKMSVFFFTQ